MDVTGVLRLERAAMPNGNLSGQILEETAFFQLVVKSRVDKLFCFAILRPGIGGRDLRENRLDGLVRQMGRALDERRSESVCRFERFPVFCARIFAEHFHAELFIPIEPIRRLAVCH